jgi:hypothetical protein
MTDEPAHLGWHVISGDLLLELLNRAKEGENPGLLYAELWANATHEVLNVDAEEANDE